MVSDKVISVINSTTLVVKDNTGVEKTFRLDEVFGIEEDNLSAEFMQQASLYAYFAMLQTRAEWVANMTELGKDQEEAAADEAYRADLDRKGKKFTETVVRGLVVRDDQVDGATKKLHESRFEQKLLKALCSALEMRAQMLQSLGSHLRHELDQTGLKTRESAFTKSVDSVKELMKEKRK